MWAGWLVCFVGCCVGLFWDVDVFGFWCVGWWFWVGFGWFWVGLIIRSWLFWWFCFLVVV